MRFVVHQHDATTLHWDLNREHSGSDATIWVTDAVE